MKKKYISLLKKKKRKKEKRKMKKVGDGAGCD